MNKETEYLLRYVSNECYKKIITKNKNYLEDELINNRVDVELNIRYLIKLGVKNIDRVVLERLDDLLLLNNEFETKMHEYERNLTKDGLIDMLENS